MFANKTVFSPTLDLLLNHSERSYSRWPGVLFSLFRTVFRGSNRAGLSNGLNCRLLLNVGRFTGLMLFVWGRDGCDVEAARPEMQNGGKEKKKKISLRI